ncbi:27499_t:CDS:2, partial [Dentiscutata erythropus]
TAKYDWGALKDEIIKKIRNEDDEKIRIKQLKSIVQNKEKTVREYINRFDAYMEPIKDVIRKDEKLDWFLEELNDSFRTRVEFRCPKKYDNARKWALQVENYQRKKECKDIQKDTVIQEEGNYSIQSEIDELKTAFSDIKINCVDQPSIKREEIDGSKVIKWFNCYEEGHMAQNCPKQNYSKENKSDDIQIVGADVRFIVLMEGQVDVEQDHLQVEIMDANELFDK